ncbi:uncharacterized protein LOC119302471 [Triticum dicoccoides]|uniref:uncharacterized protein LOC119302471 n=1 Tax=Triticum dicoccoides TaxID=85692 RepID=UPI0018905B3C|nr:uncharacterized protein LOC119302471 [Triticum dicoccoides]
MTSAASTSRNSSIRPASSRLPRAPWLPTDGARTETALSSNLELHGRHSTGALPLLPPHSLTWESAGANVTHNLPHVQSTSCSSIRSIAPLTCRNWEDHGLHSFFSEQHIHCRGRAVMILTFHEFQTY